MPSENQWSNEQLEYQLSVYKLVRVALNVFGSDGISFTGSLAINSYFAEHERRMVNGVDIVLRSHSSGDLHSLIDLRERINSEFEREGLTRDLWVNGTTIRLGLFEAVKDAGAGRARLIALVSGGHMPLKKACRLVPSGGSKLAYLDGDKALSELKVSPLFFDLFYVDTGGIDHFPNINYSSTLQKNVYINDAARRLGLSSVEISVPSLEYFVASKLNMIYQASINEGVIKATPLATHYAVKTGRQRVSGVDVFDFVYGARRVNPAAVKRSLKPMVVEPMNAMLDMAASAFRRLSASKHFEDLNLLLPANRLLTPKEWESMCSEAVLRLKRIRES